jgi:two-component system response regulator MprA
MHAASAGPAHILVVDDEPAITDLLATALRYMGYRVSTAASGRDALDAATSAAPDLVVLDVMLPDIDGFEVCRRLRAARDFVPVIFLSARDTEDDRVTGFVRGGDDYVTKPFSFAEVIVRLQALLRRATEPAPAPAVNGLVLDPARHAVTVGDRSRTLTPTELRLLGAMAARTGNIVRRRELVAAGWPHGAHVSENTLDAYVARLRRKLRELPGAPTIHTTHGVGYTLE